MVPVGSSFFSVSDRPSLSAGAPGSGPTVVWLWGEHDLSTDEALRATLASAIALDSAGSSSTSARSSSWPCQRSG